MTSSSLEQGLRHFLPQGSISRVVRMLEDHPCHLHISKHRESKRGDFRPAQRRGETHRISVNGSLNQYSFLVTLVHEIAHLVVWEVHGRRVKPHGLEWQTSFRELLHPFIEDQVFPETLQHALHQHLHRPSASSCSDVSLLRALNRFDSDVQGSSLESLHEGAEFQYRNRRFRKGGKRRTRFLCHEVPGNRPFTFHPLTNVTQISTKEP